MTREEYIKNLRPEEYVGKHEKKYYNIYRVLGPAGPEERFSVTGIVKAAEYVLGCWDWEVTDMTGKPVSAYTLDYFLRKERERGKLAQG